MIEMEILKPLGTKMGTYCGGLDFHFKKKGGAVQAGPAVNVTIQFHDEGFWDFEIRDSKTSNNNVIPVVEDFQRVITSLFDEIVHAPNLLVQGFHELGHWRESILTQKS